MKKMDFVSLVLGIVGLLVFGIGMCMCLIKEWGMFTPGVVVIVVGIVLLAVLAALRWKLAGSPAIHVNGKLLLKVIYGAVGVLVFGGGRLLLDGETRQVFRSGAALEEASVLPPQITRLSHQLSDLLPPADTVEEMEEAIRARRREGASV